MDSAPNTTTRRVQNAGKGLFTIDAVPAGREIVHIDRPLGYALDSSNIQSTCANCLRKSSTYDQIGDEELKLKRCLGCQVVKYCGTDCQRKAFKLGHRYECKTFSVLYPNVLPNTVRLLLRLLLRRQNRSLGDTDWSALLSLQSHVTEFQAQKIKNEDGLTPWQTIELMSQAAAKYSGTSEPLVNIREMVARILINSHTLTTPTLDPLGLCLSPESALINHSCAPNTHIVFSGQKLVVRSLAAIEAGTELTISYVDATQPTAHRQAKLQSRYFFTCTCPSCSAVTTNGMKELANNPDFQRIEDRAMDLQAEAVKLSPIEAGKKLQTALELFTNYAPCHQPYASIHHNAFLNAVARQEWPLALQYALQAYFDIDPINYRMSWHPVRVVRKWVLLRLVVQIVTLMQEGDKSLKSLDQFNIDWPIVVEGLWKEISNGVRLSHGVDNALTEEVRLMGKGIGIGVNEIGEENLKRQWMKLRKIGDRSGSQAFIAG